MESSTLPDKEASDSLSVTKSAVNMYFPKQTRCTYMLAVCYISLTSAALSRGLEVCEACRVLFLQVLAMMG